MTKTVVITQSNYLPWRGYFDLMRRCDLFVLYDVVQFTRRDWRNRNIIKTRNGPLWLTVPVEHGPQATTAIDEVTVAEPRWAARHIETLRHNYRQAPAFAEVSPWLFDLLQSVSQATLLSSVNAQLLRAIASRLGITTEIVSCTEILPRGALLPLDRDARLLALCEAARATRYLSGPAAKAYLDVDGFEARGIEVAFMSYDGYPEYPQLWGGFAPKVSIVDLLLNTGAAAAAFTAPPPIRNDLGREKWAPGARH
jgi:hypothetical protein